MTGLSDTTFKSEKASRRRPCGGFRATARKRCATKPVSNLSDSNSMSAEGVSSDASRPLRCAMLALFFFKLLSDGGAMSTLFLSLGCASPDFWTASAAPFSATSSSLSSSTPNLDETSPWLRDLDEPSPESSSRSCSSRSSLSSTPFLPEPSLDEPRFLASLEGRLEFRGLACSAAAGASASPKPSLGKPEPRRATTLTAFLIFRSEVLFGACRADFRCTEPVRELGPVLLGLEASSPSPSSGPSSSKASVTIEGRM
mmetsp:Transcript_79108/g.226823  ORF Transcript_79108/g.226823 Transcript_79108/m.226823 type:complete len:257 (-) Transcript_79108:78-848(-)